MSLGLGGLISLVVWRLYCYVLRFVPIVGWVMGWLLLLLFWYLVVAVWVWCLEFCVWILWFCLQVDVASFLLCWLSLWLLFACWVLVLVSKLLRCCGLFS